MNRPSDPLRVAVAALPLAAALFAGGAGWSWYSAAHAATLGPARARDAALAAGEQAVQNFNTLDYHRVAEGIRLWEQSSAGPLHAQIVAGQAQFEQQVRQAQTVTTAKILDAALTSLNLQAGTARIIAAVQITVTPPHGSPVVKQSRLEGVLTRTASGWKLSSLGQTPVGTAAGSGG